MSHLSSRRAALVIGLAVGLALSLVYTWAIAPVELVSTYPALLRTDYRRDWIRLVALSYVAGGDLERARARLDGLDQQDVTDVMPALIEEYASAGRPADMLRRLTALAEALDVYTPVMLVYLHTPTSPPTPTSTPSPTPTCTCTPMRTPTPHVSSPLATPTRKPTRTPRPLTPTPTPPPPFQLTQQEQICEPEQTPHIEVVVRDEHGAGLDGVVVWMTWPGGADRAVTGLKPRHGAGYADFNAEPDVGYTFSIGELGMPLVTDLRIEPCPAQKGKEPLPGSWRIVIEHRLPETQ